MSTCFFVSLKEFLVNLFKEFFAFAQQHVRSADACLTRNRPLSPSIFLYLLLTSYKDSSTSESIEAPSPRRGRGEGLLVNLLTCQLNQSTRLLVNLFFRFTQGIPCQLIQGVFRFRSTTRQECRRMLDTHMSSISFYLPLPSSTFL